MLPQTFTTHLFAAPAQAAPFAPAQVFVVALHSPVAHTAAALAAEHVPLWRVSFAIATPARSLALQVKLERSQYCAALQSLSTQQPSSRFGMHAPPRLHLADWHSDADPAVHPASPSLRPHLLLLPQRLVTHWFAAAQVPPFASAQVFVLVLQAPL